MLDIIYMNFYKYIINFVIIIFGLISGMLLAYLFNKNNTKYHGPNSNIIRKKIHLFKNKYYKYEPVICICPL